jgi:DNA-directed RNA polymerase subunit K/omega
MVPPQVVTGPGHKPLSISFEEIAAGKIVRVDEVDEVEVADEAADAAADDAD